MSISTALLATSMSALPILGVQKHPRVKVFTYQKGSWAGLSTSWDSMYDIYWKCLMSERKDPIVREELGFGASGLPVIWQGTQGSYALSDKSWMHLSSKLPSKIDTRHLLEDKFDRAAV